MREIYRGRRSLLLLLLCLITLTACGKPGAAPEETSAEAVVKQQLRALQNNDDPEKDTGIKTAWAYAHPANQAATGPLERFTAMLKGNAYSPLIDHDSHRVSLVAIEQNQAVFDVTVFAGASGPPLPPLRYRWIVERVRSGEDKDQWRTTAVSPPVQVGEPPV